ncbi:uncharacterized protein [Elaeis guineensis]|uniref:uncharacterized protein n=1 Tax=Elaeis guineensis var. tenera TaxID=51953 RepID=UPI003C6D8701
MPCPYRVAAAFFSGSSSVSWLPRALQRSHTRRKKRCRFVIKLFNLDLGVSMTLLHRITVPLRARACCVGDLAKIFVTLVGPCCYYRTQMYDGGLSCNNHTILH